MHANAGFCKNYQKKIAKFGWELVPQPSYLTDLVPYDYHLFCCLSNDLREKIFENEKALNSELRKFFDSETQEFYVNGIHDLRLWAEVMKTNGEYILDK